MKYHRRWKIQMAVWRLWICKRDLCISFLSHPCFAYLCRVAAVNRTARVTVGAHRARGPGGWSTQPREGKNEHRKFSMRGTRFHPMNWGSGQPNLAMPCCLQFLCHHHTNPYSSDHSNWWSCCLELQWQRSQSAWSFLVFLCQHDSMILFYDSVTYCPFFDEKLNQYSPFAPSTWQMQSELFT